MKQAKNSSHISPDEKLEEALRNITAQPEFVRSILTALAAKYIGDERKLHWQVPRLCYGGGLISGQATLPSGLSIEILCDVRGRTTVYDVSGERGPSTYELPEVRRYMLELLAPTAAH